MIPLYELHKLGWHGFQQLCQTVLREILGQTVESFLDTNDGGRDGAFSGKWKVNKGEDLAGRFVFQCKFSNKPNTKLSLSNLNDELDKAKRLVKAKRCDSYILITNAGISGRASEKIEDAFKDVGVKKVVLFGGTWLSEQIRDNVRLRTLVPRVYGLGDLSEIIDERVYDQARALLASLKEDLSKVVVTGTYRKAIDALNKHGFVLLIGEPAAGKTTIASLLAMAALDQWKLRTLKLDDSNAVMNHWNPNVSDQFFWVDDAFGVTQYEPQLTKDWNRVMPQIKAILKSGSKVVMTSRDYIYNSARSDLKEGTFPLLQESQVVIDVHDLKIEEKRHILYNHLKLGKQKRKFLKDIKPHLEGIASSVGFVPELARRLSDPAFTKELYLTSRGLDEFVNKQEKFVEDVIRGLDNNNKAALALVYMRNNELRSPVELQESEENAISRLDSSIGGCIAALNAMNNTFVQFTEAEGYLVWRFKHPTIGDAFASILITNPELLSVYINGTSVEKLVYQITCGNLKRERAVIIPKNLFPLMINKLSQFSSTAEYRSKHLSLWRVKDIINGFLTYRCSKDFISLFLSNNTSVLKDISSPGLFLNSVSEVGLAHTLYKFGLLPEDIRKKFINQISYYAITCQDFYALYDFSLKEMFEVEEFNDLKNRVEKEVLTKLNSARLSEQDLMTDQSREDKMEPFLESLERLKGVYSYAAPVIKEIERQIEFAKEWILDDDNEKDDDNLPPRRKLDDSSIAKEFTGNRSVFDDIDF